MQIIKYIFAFFLFNISNVYASCGTHFNNSKTTVLFVNGIFNGDEQACASSDNLRAVLANEKIDIKSVNFEYYHNRNSWKDIFELEIQARLSDEAIKLSGGNMTKYYTELGRIYKEKIGTGRVDQIYGTTQQLYNITKNLLLDNQKLIFVTHSQANFFIEAVYSMLSNDALTDPRAGEMLKNFRIVGAGVVAYSSPNGRYISSTSDKALMGMVADNEPINLYFKVLERKHTPCLSDVCGVSIPWLQYGDLSAHGFGETYLSNVLVDKVSQKKFSSIVAGMIKASLSELNQKCDIDCIVYNGNTYPAYYSSFLKINRYGNVLENNSKREDGWACTYSKITNTIFEYRPEIINIDGGWPALNSETIEDVDNKISSMNKSEFCGKNAWRLPKSGELSSNIGYFDIDENGINLSIPKNDIPLIGSVAWLYVSDKPTIYECPDNNSAPIWHVGLGLAFKCHTSGIYFGVPISN